MNKLITDYLDQQRICVLGVEMPDGAPHAATVHFACSPEPFRFYFLTDIKSHKARPLADKQEVRATVVVGFDEAQMKTFQADGVIARLAGKDLDTFNRIYLAKFPEKRQFMTDPARVAALMFIPAWWRYTDMRDRDNKTIISSEVA